MNKQLLFFILASVFSFAQNSLMVSPQTGNMITSGTISNFKLISDGNSVALVATNNASGKVFIVDVNDKNPADKLNNTIAVSSTTVKTRIGAALGQTVTSIKNIEVNPISNSVYAMVLASSTPYIVKLTNGGSTISVLNFNSLPYCVLNFTNANCTFQDITWGGNRLFISSNHGTLMGELGYISAPFSNNTTITKRSTTMFKSNWGGSYYTNAPLEKLNYIEIGGTEFLCGVTTCAPGFSETVSSLISNSGLFTVRESFDMVFDSSVKTVAMNNGSEAYLLNLHDNWPAGKKIYRIGKRFIDGTPLTNNTTNNSSVKLRSTSGAVNPALVQQDITEYPGSFSSIAYYSQCKILTLSTDEQTLSPLTVCNSILDVKEENKKDFTFKISPNPVKDILTVSYNMNLYKKLEVSIYSTDGKLIRSEVIDSKKNTISTADLQYGNYLLKIANGQSLLSSKWFIKE
ncbi:hypothetical protein CHRY9390_02413 [Chryseobacterium aquaeductus]|uniref:Secretion system C-terminal sorting domain-containing protein n=1 Tax=Chryseobacterium aquaeductus TaxID=2675056 RepID=A0A9N8MH58_9FLAO|nr:T9SS type A sorting domain-containing protein [Chryseobacterium aquaeductus]CAA7331699.1 hypothetical protein CHRY9390_02413 [Chryseobacterium potabilaquae]CAD7811773.1 hypothetical protein CHRY9390_02413 [Chryseobacterium aquaeductus]